MPESPYRRRLRALALALPVLLLGLHAGVAPLHAQSIVRGEIEGVVRATDERPLAEAFVTVTEIRTGATNFLETARDGSFLMPLLRSGEYEVLVEALGYIPRLHQGISVVPGESFRLPVELISAPPPVERVDTVRVGAATGARFSGETGRRIARDELASFPDRRTGLSGVAAMNPVLDESLGSEGLPGFLTRTVVDGIPFTAVSHPLERGGAGDLPLFPRIGLDRVEVHRGNDVEWSGAAGSYLSAMTRSAARETGAEFFGSGTTGALWQADPLSGFPDPEMTSFWGGGAGHLSTADETTQLFVGLEGLQAKTPALSPFGDDLATRLLDARPPVEGTELTELTEPWVGTRQALSGLARLDWRVAENAEVMARAAFGTVENGSGRFFARPLEYGGTLPVEGTDISAAASVLAEVHPRVDLELRAGFERSERDWAGTEGGTEPPLVPSTRFLENGSLLGADPGLPGSVSRTAFEGAGVAHLRLTEHQLKAGVALSVPSWDFRHVFRSGGEFLFSDPESIEAGEGVYYRSEGAGTPRSFTMPEVGVFLQHRWEPIQGIRVTTGIRFNRESLPGDQVALNTRWFELTGLRNNDLPDALTKFDTRLGVRWDLTGDGRTVFEGGVGTHHGSFDPAAVNEVIALSGQVRQRRQVGGLGAWPELPAAGGGQDRPVLALFGPGLEAPRTTRAAFGLSQRLGESTSLHVSGTIRQTRFLLRRADVNRTLQPSGTLADGRPVYGTLTKVGSLVVAEPGSNRRFSEFDQVWALNGDGWSEYQGFTLALEHGMGPSLDLFGSYTWSSTEDNLPGARAGIPEARVRPGLGGAVTDWADGTSDFDVTHRATAGVRSRFEVLDGLELGGVFRFRSGLPFTPGYRPGVDANGDGFGHNDPAFVDAAVLDGEASAFTCVTSDLGQIARRNGCRSESASFLDLHASLGLFRVGASVASLTLEVLNVLDAELGLPDRALFLVDGAGALETDPGTGVVTIPLVANPTFGTVTNPWRPGRMIRVGLRVALP